MGFTQEEITDYEAAVETITQLVSIYTGKEYVEENKEFPDQAVIDDLNQEILRLVTEQADLEISERAKIARIRLTYGMLVRGLRADQCHGQTLKKLFFLRKKSSESFWLGE